MGAFNAAALGHGEFPEWMPFQCMGYPYLLNAQSGLFYPPTWVFPLLRIPYSLHAAVVLQCLHVLFGAIGAYAFFRRTAQPPLALIGATMFHFFGGFYSNASDLEMVRAFALLPWLFHGATLVGPPPRLTRAAWVLPLWLALLGTGGYLSNVVAFGLALVVYWLVQLAVELARGAPARALVRISTGFAGLALLGTAMAAIRLAPTWFDRQALFRLGEVNLERFELGPRHGLTLFLSGRVVEAEPTMTSCFVGVAAVVALFFLGLRSLRAALPIVATLLFALAMGAGASTPVWRAAADLFSPIKYSRFPSSDYRPVIALCVISLALGALRVLAERGLGLRFLVRAALALAALAGGAWLAYGNLDDYQPLLAVVLGAAALALLALVARQGRVSWPLGILLAGVTAADAAVVLPDMKTWHVPAVSDLYRRWGWSLEVDGRPLPEALFDRLPAVRPARDPLGVHQKRPDYQHWPTWAGYLQGRYMMSDHPSCQLRSAEELQNSPGWLSYMAEEWRPVLLDPHIVPPDGGRVVLPAAVFARRTGEPATARAVKQEKYGIDEVDYRVELDSPALMVENEVYYPGWSADLKGAVAPQTLHALPAGPGLRAWVLPAGDYRMHSRFRYPRWRLYAAITIAATAAWLGLALARRAGLQPVRFFEDVFRG